MSVYTPPVDQHEAVIKAALRVIEADHYFRESDPHADAEQEYAAERLALAARALVHAVDLKPADEQPIGWDVDALVMGGAQIDPAIPNPQKES